MASSSQFWKSKAEAYLATVSATVDPTSTRYPGGGDWLITAPGKAVGLLGAGALPGAAAATEPDAIEPGAATGAYPEAATPGICTSTNLGSPNLIPTRVKALSALTIGTPVRSGITKPSTVVSSAAATSKLTLGFSIP